MLAFDGYENSAQNLTNLYAPTIEGIRQGTVGDKTAVVLVDLTDQNDPYLTDHILVIEDGVIVDTLTQLPQSDGTLSSPAAYEYDMTDGGMLGGFVKWARDSYPADKTTFSFIGHGQFAMPATELDGVFTSNGNPSPTPNEPPAPSIFPAPQPLPALVWATPNPTDAHTTLAGNVSGIITPHALAHAMEIATDNGNNPLDVLDVVHCFAQSLEQAYELSNPDGTPYAAYMVGSPNYAFYTPTMPGAALAAIDATMDAETLAATMMHAYDTELSSADTLDGDSSTVEYPRSITVLKSDALAPLKNSFDYLSTHLINSAFATDAPRTVARLKAAQGQVGVYYDSDYCSGEFNLDKEDALMDVGSLAQGLINQFNQPSQYPSDSLITAAAYAIRSAANNVVVTQTLAAHATGIPAFTGNPSQSTWVLDDNDSVGLSVFADLHGNDLGSDQYRLSWYTRYYTHTITNSLQFVQPLPASNPNTWADVIDRYWQVRVGDGDVISTEACLPVFPLVAESAEFSIDQLIYPIANVPMFFGSETALGGSVTITGSVSSVPVQFRVIDGITNTPEFTTTVHTSPLLTGTHYIEALETWTVDRTPFHVEMIVNPAGAISETIAADNVYLSSAYYAMSSGTPFTLTATTGIQWTDGSGSVPITFTSTVSPVDILTAKTYGFVASSDVHTQVPVLIDTSLLGEMDNLSETKPYMIPVTAQAGVHEVDIWAQAGGLLSTSPQRIRINYAPPNVSLQPNDVDHFVFEADANDVIELTATFPTGVDVLVWKPGALLQAAQIPSSGTATFTSTIAGLYVVEVRAGATNATYTLTSTRNGTPNARFVGNTAAQRLPSVETVIVEAQRPEFLAPKPQPEYFPVTSVGLSEIETTQPASIPIVIVILLLCLASVTRQAIRRDN